MQSTEAACGPCAISNGCKFLGPQVEEDEAARWVARVSKVDAGVQGTTEHEILRAINEGAPKKYRLRARGLAAADGALARDALRGALTRGAVALLAVDGDSHWATAIAVNGERYVVVDGAEKEVTVAYTWDQLRARWEVPGNPPTFYAVLVTRGG
jgi:hypothetical protein